MNRKKKRRATGRSAAKSAHDTKQRESFQSLVGTYRRIVEEQGEKRKLITDPDELRDAEISTERELMRVLFF